MALKKGKLKDLSTVFVTIDSDKEGMQEISFSYYVPSAGWESSYDFRVAAINEPLSIEYNANVYQSTGEDWVDAKLTFSNMNPKLDNKKPELEEWILGKRMRYNNAKLIAGQGGTLQGKLVDRETKEPLMMATVRLFQNGVFVKGTSTDFDWEYKLNPLEAGSYEVRFEYVGYESHVVKGVRVTSDHTTALDGVLHEAISEMEAVEIVMYKEPLINLQETATVYSAEELSGLGVGSSSGAYMNSTRGGSSRSRGSRSEDNEVYIDGVKVLGSRGSSTYASSIDNKPIVNLSSQSFEVKRKQAVRSNGDETKIFIKEKSVPVEFTYHIVPKFDNEAFLMADIKDWQQLELLPGKNNIYYEGKFIGESFVDAYNTSDTLSVSLGRDKHIMIKRTQNRKKYEKRTIGNNKKERFYFNIEIKNNKQKAINVVIEDHIPVAKSDQYNVTLMEGFKGQREKDKGMLKWQLKMSAGELQRIEYGFEVKYPKWKNVYIQ